MKPVFTRTSPAVHKVRPAADEALAALRSPAALLACLAASAAFCAPARGSISAAETLDGPSADIVAFDGAAMAGDGTGGIVYRRRVDGRVHVFAAQFDGTRWRAPVRVDNGQRFDSQWPAIGAADGGRLVVVWAQDFGPADRLFSATLGPGARRFQAPVPVDTNVGDPIALHPSVALSRGGQGFLSYVVASEDPTLPSGYVRGEIRLARYTGELWSSAGVPQNRNADAPLRRPTAQTAPQVAADAQGGGLLAWQEPDEELIDRIWARRLFGGAQGFVLPVSPRVWNDKPLRAPADAFAVDTAGIGQGAVAFRQQGTPDGVLSGTRVMVATLAESFRTQAREFGAPRIVDGGGVAGPATPPSSVDVAVAAAGVFAAPFAQGATSVFAAGDDEKLESLGRLDAGTSAVAGVPQADLSESGAAVFAWRQSLAGRQSVGLRERRFDGVEDNRTVFAARGGAVEGLVLAGSGLGDGIAGWQQGVRDGAQIAAAVVDAPPGEFGLESPADFLRPRDLELRWDPPQNGIGKIRYTVTLDDDTIAENVTATRLTIPRKELSDGVAIAQVLAVDVQGQETTSAPAELKIDGTAPRTTVTRVARGVRVRIRDGAAGQVAGVDAESVRIRFGDGRVLAGRTNVTHRYRRPGTYRVTTTARDLAGNVRTTARRVRVR